MQQIYLIGEDERSTACPLLWETAAAHDGHLVCVPVQDWNRQLSPWFAPGLRQGEDFTGEAQEFLRQIEETVRREEENAAVPAENRCILGYSLAGLFSLWCASESSLFGKAASVSGSLWYDGWPEWLQEHPSMAKYVYLSLGAKEKNAGNRRMQCVEQNTLKTRQILLSKEIPCDFELNPGGHFNHPEERLKRAIEQLLSH